MNPLDLIQKNFYSFTKTEENIGAYILNNPYAFARSTIEDSVNEIGTSKPALIRFAKKLGYNGYSEFKYDVAKFIISESYNSTEEHNDSPIKQITDTYCQFISQMNETIDVDTLAKVVSAISNARKTKIFAVNRTALSATQLQLRALKIGYDIDCVDDRIAMNDVINTLNENDVCILFTIKNNSKIYDSIVNTLETRKVTTVLVTMTPTLSIISKCNHVIYLPQVNKGYAKFIDEQALYFVFVEILLNQLITINK